MKKKDYYVYPAALTFEEGYEIAVTLTLPAWLNARALESGVNFSAVLQDALKSQLNINR